MRNGRSTLPLARAVVRLPSRAGGHVRDHLDAEAFHHALEHRRFRDRPVVEIERGRNALERIASSPVRRLGRHGVEQEAERRLDVLAVDAAIFLVGDARTVIDHGEQHQGRRAGRSASIHGGAFSCFRSDGLMSKCHSAFECSAWKRTAGGWRIIRSWS